MLSKSKFAQIVGKNIKRERTSQGLKQDKLSIKAGFYPSYISLIETASRVPSSYSLHRIAKALGVSVTKLYPATDN
ncbi:MAG: XRE family transcriptional regulator [bacterium]|nr:XRE family transcriptional regulator [Candidatus Microgenomates bacterium CPR3]MCQ3944959.1 XRE family transcriptional regulator [bacterium]